MTMRVAIVADLEGERWPSMDLIAEQLTANLPVVAPEIEVTLVRPSFTSRLGRAIGRYKARYYDYGSWLGARRDAFDIFHVVDHSYAHLVHRLPRERTVVTCHDIDAFRCLAPLNEPASFLYKRIAPRVLAGLRRAAHVTCDSEATERELIEARLVEPACTSVVPNGVHPAFLREPSSTASSAARRLLGVSGETELLHVGSTIPRKQIEFLLELFAMLRERDPHLHLVQVGGELTRSQRALAERFAVASAVTVLPPVDVQVLAAIYRRASLVMLPSTREGFGLPVIEAMASGTPVIASDLPVLREVGDDVAVYAPAHDIFQWAAATQQLIHETRSGSPPLIDRIHRGKVRAERFSWTRYAGQMAGVYRQALGCAAVPAW